MNNTVIKCKNYLHNKSNEKQAYRGFTTYFISMFAETFRYEMEEVRSRCSALYANIM